MAENRRTFMKNTLAVSGAAATLLRTSTGRAADASDKVSVGLIGCGGRGTYLAGVFASNPNVEISYV